jgi:cyclomaltodextrinase
MEFIFGTLATDRLRLLHHQLARTGVQHQHIIEPLDPEPNQAVTLNVVTGGDFPAISVACYFTTDGSAPDGSKGDCSNGIAILLTPDALEWDTPTWSYSRRWHGTLPSFPHGTTVRYRISAWTEDGSEAFADWPELKATTERAAAAFFIGEDTVELPPLGSTEGNIFEYHVDRFTVPHWAKDAVIYEILVDRFYPGDGREWTPSDNLSDFFGGTLWGVRDKLDYIEQLSVNCIWLTPIFASPSHHGYDATDFHHVDERYGGDEALHALVGAAHARDIRVLLDLAVNHASNQHPYFVDALSNVKSTYRDWFVFDDSEVGYKTFFNVPSLPVINIRNAPTRKWMFEVGAYWLREFDVDGYRLDHANGPGADFWPGFRAACRAVNPDVLMFGEVVEAPDIQRTYVGRLDGVLDFHMEDALRKTFAFGTMSEAELDRFMTNHYAYFPDDFLMPTFLDSHDMDRILFVVDGDISRLKRAAEAQFRLPGPPIIYYGTEVGLTQQASSHDGLGLEASRLPMLWDTDQNTDLLAFYQRLIKQRTGR